MIYAVTDPARQRVWFLCEPHAKAMTSQNPGFLACSAMFRTYCGACTRAG